MMNDEMREEQRKKDMEKNAGLTTPEDIDRIDDIIYGGDSVWQSLDLYRPKESDKDRLPVIVSIHGGAWVYGDKGLYQFYCMSLAQRGFAVVNPNYRLAPEHRFPAQLEDINSVFRWVLENSGKFGLDAGSIFAVGDSAGANLLGCYANICTNISYAANFPFKVPERLRLLGIALNCGMYDPSPDKIDSFTNKFVDDYLSDASQRKLIDVSNHVTCSFLSAFIMSAYGDFVRTQAPILEQTLRSLKVPFSLRMFGEQETHAFNVDIKNPIASICNDEECGFFKSLIRK